MTNDFVTFLLQQSTLCFAIGFLLPAAWPKHFGKKGVTHK